ncbi:MAG: hypothetical protein IPF53_07625 [Blastocatellia bacterium]|nr:hypothetical protein [Blastocatellia bacterium]
MTGRRLDRGAALLEQLIALAALVVVGTAAVMLMGSTERARREAQPAADRVWTRATAAGELALCESAAADLAYFDLTATIAAARHVPRLTQNPERIDGPSVASPTIRSTTAAAPSPTTPPAGYCGPMVLSNPGTWPPGFDPRDNSTWSSVEWWSGASTSDPSTWYYRCATPGTGGRLAPVYSYGDGVVFAGGDGGASVAIVGPAAVVPDTVKIYSDQTGDALVMLRTEPSMPRLSLGAAFETTGNTIRLVASDQATRAAVEGLVAGDVLVVTGNTATGATRTAIAELRETPSPVLWPSPLDTAGQPILQYFQASVEPSSSTFRWGLRNAAASAAGVVIDQDASVAVLDRAGGVVVFYTAGDRSGTSLLKVIGGVVTDPQQLARRAGSQYPPGARSRSGSGASGRSAGDDGRHGWDGSSGDERAVGRDADRGRKRRGERRATFGDGRVSRLGDDELEARLHLRDDQRDGDVSVTGCRRRRAHRRR